MNKILLYTSKTGSTKKCAEYIVNDRSVEMHDITSFNGSLDDYDTIILGSPVYIGQIAKVMTEFIKANEDLLLNKELIIYLCSMNQDTYEEMINLNFSEEIRNHANIVNVGGAYYFDKLNWFKRFVVKKLAKVTETTESYNYSNLDTIRKQLS